MRKILLNLKIALRSLYNFKLRSALAVLGVFLGTFSLIVVSNLSASLAEKTDTEIKEFGENLLIVKSGIIRSFGSRTRLLSEATNLTLEDAAAIQAGSKFVEEISPSMSKTFPIRYEDTVLPSILVVGAAPNFPSVRNFRVKTGAFFSRSDNNRLKKVVVLGTKVVEKLFIDQNPIGKYILLRRAPCQVIGIMEEKGSDISGADQDNQIFIPLRTFMRRFLNVDYIDSIYVKVIRESAIPLAKAEIESILRKRHKIKPGEDDDFTVIDLKDVLALKTEATGMIVVLGRTSAIIAFFIGGIGILSIMILIVNERKVEIGIRRAVGSRKRDIVYLFLLESSFISFLGGSVGVALGLITSAMIFKLSGLPYNLSMAGMAISFIASVTVGILAGIYPSQKAIGIQPIDIIRS
jgi:putative ABC transport system permease protein